jgi:hypothetical protein
VPISPDLSDRVTVVSGKKAGTHLIHELMAALDYGSYGTATRWCIAEQVFSCREVTTVWQLGPDAFTKDTDDAWNALAWRWQIKSGLPPKERYGREAIDAGLVRTTARRTAGGAHSSGPERPPAGRRPGDLPPAKRQRKDTQHRGLADRRAQRGHHDRSAGQLGGDLAVGDHELATHLAEVEPC